MGDPYRPLAATSGVQPNQISVLGVILAGFAAVCLVLAGRSDGGTRIALFLVAAVAIPLRLLCNMLDGMLAVEGVSRRPPATCTTSCLTGIADLLFLAGAGYAIAAVAWGAELGWAAAVAALLTAYVRTLGVAAGAAQHFDGPVAKPRRMHVLFVACLVRRWRPLPAGRGDWVMAVALTLHYRGGLVTIVRRLGGSWPIWSRRDGV